jgi:hypothetical protein
VGKIGRLARAAMSSEVAGRRHSPVWGLCESARDQAGVAERADAHRYVYTLVDQIDVTIR